MRYVQGVRGNILYLNIMHKSTVQNNTPCRLLSLRNSLLVPKVGAAAQEFAASHLVTRA